MHPCLKLKKLGSERSSLSRSSEVRSCIESKSGMVQNTSTEARQHAQRQATLTSAIPVYRPMTVSKGERSVTFNPGVTLLGERADVVLNSQQVYDRIMTGQRITAKEMFTSVPYFSPTGILRKTAHTPQNVARYNSGVRRRYESMGRYKTHCD